MPIQSKILYNGDYKRVYDLCIDMKDNIYFAVHNGIYVSQKYDPKSFRSLTSPRANQKFKELDAINAISVDSKGEFLYLVDHWNHCIYKVSTSDGEVTLFAGKEEGVKGHEDGNRLDESVFHHPRDVCVDDNTRSIYISDWRNNCIRKISNNIVSTIAGKPGTSGMKDGIGQDALFSDPAGMCLDHNGDLILCDRLNQRIRRIEVKTGKVTTIAGSGEEGSKDSKDLLSASFYDPVSLICSGDGTIIVVEDANCNYIRKISLSNGVSTIPLEFTISPSHAVIDRVGNLIVSGYNNNGDELDDDDKLYSIYIVSGLNLTPPKYLLEEIDNSIESLMKAGSDYIDLFESGKFSDVTFQFHLSKSNAKHGMKRNKDGESITSPDNKDTSSANFNMKIIKAHKLILTARCEYFRGVFNSSCEESTSGIFNINESEHGSFDAMNALLRYIYGGKLNLNNEIVIDVMRLSRYYLLNDVYGYCVKYCEHELNDDNAIGWLILSDDLKLEELYKVAMEYVTTSFVSIRKNNLDSIKLLIRNPDLMGKLMILIRFN